MFEIVIEGAPGLGRPLGSRPTTIGRAPANDIVLDDDAVSGRHAAVWTDGEAVYVQDLASRNGVRLNGSPVTGTVKAAAGDRITVGTTVLVLGASAAARAEAGSRLVLEDLASGHGTSFEGDRLAIGDAPGVHLRVKGAAEVVLVRIADDEVLLGVDDDMRPLRVGEPFAVGARTFVLRRAEGAPRETRDLGVQRAAYLLEATLEAGPGPLAVVTNPATGRAHRVTAENRATLLWILARKWIDDRGAHTAEDARGWVSEAEVLTSVWGRSVGGSPTNLRVLVCRVRKDLREAGLDPWFLEHRSGHLRARVGEATLR